MESISLGALAVWYHPTQSGTPKARVLIIHGISEHSGRHSNTLDCLTREGYEVVRFDLRGAGKSGGRRQWVSHFNDYVEDTALVFNWMNATLPSLPTFVLGHSLGGAVAAYFAAEQGRSLKGLILSAPAYKPGGTISPHLIKASHFLARVTPGIRVPKNASPDAISRDPRVVKEYVDDPLCFHFNTVKQGNEVIKAISVMPQIAEKISCPTLIVHGTADQIILLEGSYEILRNLGAQDKTLQIFPGGYHELHNDLDKELYFSNLITWLNAHA